MKYFNVVMYLLQERQQFLEEIREGIRLRSKIMGLLISSFVFLGVYGAIIGASNSWMQAAMSTIKLPALYLITVIICFPTLYFFNVMFGSKRSFEQYLAMLMTAVALMSVLLLGFAPVSLFFLISTNDYLFFKLLNVGIFGLTGFLGINFLYQGVQLLSQQDHEGEKIRFNILRFWLILYGFVGCQLGWTLRPFFGAPNTPFELFRERGGNFYLNITNSLLEILGLQ